MTTVRVGILSDIRLFTEGVKRIVSAEASLRAVDIGDEDAFAALPPGARPHVLVVDGRMARALDVCRRFGSTADLKILVVAVPDDGSLASDVLIAGARGVLNPDAIANEVVRAIALVQQGRIWAPRHVVADAWKKCRPDAQPAFRIAGWQHLSEREREVLRHAAAGAGNKELADRLAISEATVKVHLTHIFRKVGCRSRAELAAAYHGVVPIEIERPRDRPPIIVRRSAN
jgi:DNA-binding NarL/FixJ family response regulator